MLRAVSTTDRDKEDTKMQVTKMQVEGAEEADISEDVHKMAQKPEEKTVNIKKIHCVTLTERGSSGWLGSARGPQMQRSRQQPGRCGRLS